MTIYLLIGAVVLLWCFVLDKDRDPCKTMNFDDAFTLPFFVICAWPVFMYLIAQVTIEEFE